MAEPAYPLTLPRILPHGIGTLVEPDILFIRAENQPRWEAPYFQG